MIFGPLEENSSIAQHPLTNSIFDKDVSHLITYTYKTLEKGWTMSKWYLEGDFNQDGRRTQQHLQPFPVTLGRDENLDFTFSSSAVSRRHATVKEGGADSLMLNDLRSSNGTFVNRDRIDGPTLIQHGDIIHLGTMEMRLIDHSHLAIDSQQDDEPNNTTTVISIADLKLSETIPAGVNQLEELIDKKMIEIFLQPIVHANGGKTCGYEILAKGTNPNLTSDPAVLYSIAESIGLEVQLSTLMRNTAVDIAVQYKVQGMVLVSTHPKELEDYDQLLRSLSTLRKRHPKILLMLEISEKSVTDLAHLALLKAALNKLSIRYAFVDFGTGQSRFMDLINAQPHLVKFDKALIEGIDTTNSARLSVLIHLHDIVRELRIKTLATCVDTKPILKSCKPIGFDMYQGNYFGEAIPADQLNNES